MHVPEDIIERARDAVYWTPGLTLAGLVEHGLELALAAEAARRSAPFEMRGGALRTGRPVR